MSNQAMKELEGETGSASQTPDNQKVAMATARASNLPLLIVSGADSPRSRIGRGLESIGGMTAETLQRISTTVGGVVKSPVVLMAKVGGLASPRAPALTTPPESSLEERVFHLEMQMKSFEEKFNSRIVVTELDLSSCSHKEKPRIVKNLLQEMEMEETLVKRVQMLEDCVNERIERIEKALSSIQSQLDHIEFSRHESVVGYGRPECLSGEPQYYDADQHSDNFEAPEVGEQSFFGAHGVFGEAIGGSPTLEKSRVKETLFAAPTTIEHVEPLQEIDTGKNDDFLDPQVVSTPVYSKEAFLTQPLKSIAPSSELAGSTYRDDAGNLPASLDWQLTSKLEELHGSFVMESSADAASAKFLEIARVVIAEKSTLAHASLELQSAYVLKEPRETFLEEPLAAVLVAKSEEHAQEGVSGKSGTTIAIVELPLPSTFETTQKDFMKEPLVVAPNASHAQELATQGVAIIALASSEPPVTSKPVEPLVVVPSANFKELVQEDTGDKSVTTTDVGESPKAFAFQDPQEDFVKESLLGAPGAGPTHEPSSQEDSSTTSDMALAFAESPMASKFVEELSAIVPGANFEEPVEEDVANKSDNMIAIAELPLASSLEEPQEETINEFRVSVPSADFEEPTNEDVVEKTGTKMAARELSLAPSLEESKEGFEKESMASALSCKPTQEHGDMVVGSFETKGGSKFVEEALGAALSVNFGEREHKADVDKSGTIIVGAESLLASSFDNPQEDFEKKSSIVAPSAEPVEELATQEDTSVAFASFETTMKPKFVEGSSTYIASSGFEEPTREDVDKGVTMTAIAESPLASSHQGLQEDFEKESLATTPSAASIHEPSLQEDLGATSVKTLASTLASSKPQVTSKFVEEPSLAVSSANFKESAHKDEVDNNVTMTADVDSPLASLYQDPQEDFEKDSLVAAPRAGPIYEPSSLEDLGATSDEALASSEPPRGSKFVEEPSPDIPTANFQELVQEDGDVKSNTIIAGIKSPLASSFEESHDFEKESMVTIPDTEPLQELATQEDNNMAHTSFEPKVASKFVEEPSAVVPSTGFEEPTHEDAPDKGVTMTVAVEDPHKDFVKESLVAPPNAQLADELLSQEDLDAIRDMAFASSIPHLVSKFVEKPLLALPSANSEELTRDEDIVKSDTLSADANSQLVSSFDEPHEDFEKESLASTLSCDSAQELAAEEDSHIMPTSSKSQEASKFVEEPSATIPSANFEELAQEDAVDKSVAMIATGVLPFASSFEEPHEDFEVESIAVAPSSKLAQELATQEDSDMAPPEPQVASKFIEEPLAIDVPSAKFEEPTHEDVVNKSGTMTTVVESPLVSSLEHTEDCMKESLVAKASAKVLEPTKEDESAFAPLEAPSTSSFGIPQEAFSKESLEISVQPEELAQEKSGIVLPSAESSLTLAVEEGNHKAKEAEYKLVEDFKVDHEHIKSIEKEFPRSQSNLAQVNSNELKLESLVAEDNDDRPESDESGEEFFDAEHGSGNLEPWKSDDPKSFEEFGVGPDERGEATGINVVAQKETSVPASSVELAQEPMQEPGQALERELAQELGEDYESAEQAPTQKHEQHLEQEPEQELAQEHGQALVQERGKQIAQELRHKPEQQHAQEPEQEDLTRNSVMALLPLEPQVTSKFGESQELLAKESLATVPSTKFEEPAQANATDESETCDLPLTSTREEPQIDSVVSPEKNLSSASFCQSGNLELPENLKHKSLDTTDTSSKPQEALERESLTSSPTTKIAQGHDVGKSDNVHMLLEPQLEESKEALANEPMKAIPSSKSTKSAQEVGDGESGAILASSKSQLTPTMQEPQEGFVKEPLVDAKLASKFVDLEELLVDEPSAVTTSAKLAQETVADTISVGLVEDLSLTAIAEEPQNGSVSSLVEGKHGHDEADRKFLEDVKIIAEPIEEAIPRTQSDLTHVKLNLEATEDATKLQSQGSFLAFGATSVDSKEALVKESLPSAKLLELFEEESNLGKRVPVLANSPMTSTVEEPHKPLAKEALAGAKLVPKGHARWRGFSRSSSEPQFAYKLEEHQKALVKESSVVVVPSTSKLGEEYVQEDSGVTQRLPFRILGKSKHPRKELDIKLVEDVKSPATKSETTSSPYVLEPKPSKIKEKKKKEKKEKKLDATVEEKERTVLLGLGEMERKNSLRTEEKHKQPFRHLRDRLRHAFSVNKEP